MKSKADQGAKTHSAVKRIDGDSFRPYENLVGVEIRHRNILPELQNLRAAESRQHHGTATGEDAPKRA